MLVLNLVSCYWCQMSFSKIILWNLFPRLSQQLNVSTSLLKLTNPPLIFSLRITSLTSTAATISLMSFLGCGCFLLSQSHDLRIHLTFVFRTSNSHRFSQNHSFIFATSTSFREKRKLHNGWKWMSLWSFRNYNFPHTSKETWRLFASVLISQFSSSGERNLFRLMQL